MISITNICNNNNNDLLTGGKQRMKNQEIKNEIYGNGIRLWQVAERLNMSDSNLCRKLRYELPDEEKAKIRQAINEIKESEVC